jgi:hypothetical protein
LKQFLLEHLQSKKYLQCVYWNSGETLITFGSRSANASIRINQKYAGVLWLDMKPGSLTKIAFYLALNHQNLFGCLSSIS